MSKEKIVQARIRKGYEVGDRKGGDVVEVTEKAALKAKYLEYPIPEEKADDAQDIGEDVQPEPVEDTLPEDAETPD